MNKVAKVHKIPVSGKNVDVHIFPGLGFIRFLFDSLFGCGMRREYFT